MDSGDPQYSDVLHAMPVSAYWKPAGVFRPENVPRGEEQVADIRANGVQHNGTVADHQVSIPARQKRRNFNPLQRKRLIPVQGAIAAAVAHDGSADIEETAAALDDLEITDLNASPSTAVDGGLLAVAGLVDEDKDSGQQPKA